MARATKRSSTRKATSTSRTRRSTCPDTIAEGWVALAIFWLLGADGLLPVRHPLRAERLGGLDRGDRALPADRAWCSSARRSASPRTSRSRSTSSTATCRRRSAAGCRARSTCCASPSSPPPWCMTVQMMLKIGNQTRMTIVDAPMNIVYGVVLLGFAAMTFRSVQVALHPLAARLQRARAADDHVRRPLDAPHAQDHLPALHEQRPSGGHRHGRRLARLHPDLAATCRRSS